MLGEIMTRKATVDKDLVLQMLREGKTTQYIADHFGVSRQAVDLHRRDFITKGLLPDQRAGKQTKTAKEDVPPNRNIPSLDQQIELIIEAFSALRRIPKLEADIEKYKRAYEGAVHEIERLQNAEQKRQDQELRWLHAQHQEDTGSSSYKK